MMQDTVLNLCKDSVHEFVNFMLSYIPETTKIVSTAIVHNTFKKTQRTEEPDDESLNLLPNDDDLEGVKNTKIWLAGMFKKDKNPEPLYILDLILKNG